MESREFPSFNSQLFRSDLSRICYLEHSILEAERIKRLTSTSTAGGYPRCATDVYRYMNRSLIWLVGWIRAEILPLTNPCFPFKHSIRTRDKADPLTLPIKKPAIASTRRTNPTNESRRTPFWKEPRRSSHIISITRITPVFSRRVGETVMRDMIELILRGPRPSVP
ncbi:hypothetical protein BDW60DRAFT_146566 [Aspergillus nidulans var. acristatus]